MEKTNARYLKPTDLPKNFKGADIVTIDCSFISLQKIIPNAFALSRRGGIIIGLVKPQFEANKTEVDRGAGVIKDPAIHARVISELKEFINGFDGLEWRDYAESPLRGTKGNVEFLTWIEKI
jgi:23S rRNA (cytidine1920-2'-O)/16S rRNA (cytidine1409-2'-O)-methyltransferase